MNELPLSPRLATWLFLGAVKMYFVACVCGQPPDTSGVKGEIQVEEKIDPDGHRKIDRFYRDANGNRVYHGVQQQFFPSGFPSLEIWYRHGKAHGKHILWHINGTKKSEWSYIDNRPEGTWTEWTSDGDKSREATYVNGKIRGKEVVWNGGKLFAEHEFDENGKKLDTTFWHDNGQKKGYGKYDDAGKQDGVWTFWDAKGKLVSEGAWKSGHAWDGICRVRRSFGSKDRELYERYKDGELIETLDIKPE